MSASGPTASPPAGQVRSVGRAVVDDHGRPRWLLTLPMMLVSGALVAVQAQINAGLAERLGTGLRAAVLAAVVSFGSGLVVLTVLALVHRPTGRGVAELRRAVLRRQVPPWLVLGGLAGAFFVASQGVATIKLGIAFFIICFVAGQAVMALVVDHQGWGPNGRTALSSGRVLGAALGVVAVAVSGAGLVATVSVTGLFLLVAALPLVAGLLSSLQQGINGRLSARQGPWVTTWNNFFVGTLALLVLLAVTLALPGQLTGLPSQPWLYLGGLCGVGFIWASSVTVRVHGVLVVGVFAVAGQVLAATAITLLAATLPPATTWWAAGISLAGAAVVGLSQRAAAT